MKNIVKFEEFNMNESLTLSDKEKEFLWNKMETNKKKRALKTENDLYQFLKNDKKIESEEEFVKLLNSLEYSMKKRIKEGSSPRGKYEDAFKSLKEKLPKNWVGVKFSSLSAKEKRDKK